MKPKGGKSRFDRRMGLTLCLVLALAVAAIQIATPLESKAVGPDQQVSVIDGDTIEFNGTIVQLYGIDAPELGQLCGHDLTLERCGMAAAFELKKLLSIEHAALECRPARAVADTSVQVCTFGHTDLARLMLENGYAVATADAGQDYIEAQDSARQGALGLWHSRFVEPAAWRAGKRLAEESGQPDQPCPIKAIVGPDSRRLYFVPTDPDYEAIGIDPAKGDRRYCSDMDARRDGWRRVGQKD